MATAAMTVRRLVCDSMVMVTVTSKNVAAKEVGVVEADGVGVLVLGIDTQADGAYEKANNAKIDWRKFDNGADIIAAIASGDVQIGYLGSSPLTAAITRKVPVETFLVATQIGGAEALVARNGSGINSPQDLIGKKIAVPFVSTGHYSLLAALKHWNIDPSKVTILNLAPPAIIAAWKRGDIDATYVWDPALGVAKENGKVLITSGELAKFGAPTFDAWIVRKDFGVVGCYAVTLEEKDAVALVDI